MGLKFSALYPNAMNMIQEMLRGDNPVAWVLQGLRFSLSRVHILCDCGVVT